MIAFETDVSKAKVSHTTTVDQPEKPPVDLATDCPVVPVPLEAEDGNRVFVSDEMFKVLKETVPVRFHAFEGHAPLKPFGAVDVFLGRDKHRFDVAGVGSRKIRVRPVVEGSDANPLRPVQWYIRPKGP